MNAVFNYESSLHRMGDDEQLFREMIGLISEDAPRLLHDVATGFDEHDLERVRHAAHTLKGLSANFSALRAMEAAEALERRARVGNWSEMERVHAELEEAIHELLAALHPMGAQTSESF